MPRNASGVYTLPPSNPVIPATTIATTWANPTLSDIGQAITESLDRAGRGGMTAPFRLFDGTISAPGLAFLNETGLGIWRSGAGVMEFASGGTTFLSINASAVVSPVKMEHRGYDTYKKTGTYSFKVESTSGEFRIVPSASVDAEDWLLAAAVIHNYLGDTTIPGDLQVNGTVYATNWGFVNITCTNLVVSDTIAVNGIATFNSTLKAKQFEVQANASAGSAAVNFAISQSLVFTLAAPLTITTIAGLALGNIGRITVKNTAQGITFPATVKWPGPSFAPPSFTAGSLKIAIVVLEYDGTNYLANASVY